MLTFSLFPINVQKAIITRKITSILKRLQDTPSSTQIPKLSGYHGIKFCHTRQECASFHQNHNLQTIYTSSEDFGQPLLDNLRKTPRANNFQKGFMLFPTKIEKTKRNKNKERKKERKAFINREIAYQSHKQINKSPNNV